MVFNTNNEQGIDFRVHNTTWEPIDFDGIKLMLRPCPARLSEKQKTAPLRKGFSNAARNHISHKMVARHHNNDYTPSNRHDPCIPDSYVVVNIETTGLSAKDHEIIEISAIRVINNRIENEFQALIKPKHQVLPSIEVITGLSTEALKNGKDISEVMPEFLHFTENMCIVSHNSEFYFGFLRAACEQCNLPIPLNHNIDTMLLARRYIDSVRNYKRSTLLDYFGINTKHEHQGIDDCLNTQQLFIKLIEIQLESLEKTTN